jgi:CheY-like chemotaxis protein
VVLIDMHMPGMSGADVVHEIHTLAPSVPIIAMSAAITDEKEKQFLAAGCCACIPKPLDTLRMVDEGDARWEEPAFVRAASRSSE